jgi:prepilin-type N-terminal cleavage/methylation domain-containing protein
MDLSKKRNSPSHVWAFSHIRKNPAFTLVELIVVVAILAILATVGFLALSGYSSNAQDAANRANVKLVWQAISSESVKNGDSPRKYIVYQTGASLSGATFSGIVLTGGTYGTPGTNYTAGTPDWNALRLDSSKFQVADVLEWGIQTAWAATSAPFVGAMDFTETLSSGKIRPKGYFQVAGISAISNKTYVEGNFPTLSGSVAGLVWDPSSGSSTGALTDSASSSISAMPCSSTTQSGYTIPALSGGQSTTAYKSVANGTGSLMASCTAGSLSYGTESYVCSSGYLWSGLACASTTFTFTGTISADTPNYNVKTAAIAAGWNQTVPLYATVTIGTGIYVYSTGTANYAFDTGTGFYAGSTITVINYGSILGAGGAGGKGSDSSTNATAGGDGGPAFRAQYAVTVKNNGTIGGGGGGGGGGSSGSDGSAYWCGGGGGGGAGYTVGLGGGIGSSGCAGGAQARVAGHSPVSYTVGGLAGNGDCSGVYYYGGYGEPGGALGAAGGAALYTANATISFRSAGANGAGGAAVTGNSFITWTATGTRYGAIQ